MFPDYSCISIFYEFHIEPNINWGDAINIILKGAADIDKLTDLAYVFSASSIQSCIRSTCFQNRCNMNLLTT